MDNVHTSTAQDNDHELEIGGTNTSGSFPFANAFTVLANLLLTFVSLTFSYLRPFAPRLIPVFICIFTLPLAVLLSFYAGLYVWKSAAIGWEAPVHLQFGDSMLPYAISNLPPLVAHQRYDISLELAVPATGSNLALGNFMTALTLSTISNQSLASVRRSAIVFRPSRKFWLWQPGVLYISVPMLDSFASSVSDVIAHVEVGRRDGWRTLGRGEGKELSIISASIRGSIVHHGLRGLLTRFPLTFSFLSMFIFLAIITGILGACVLSTVIQPETNSRTSILSPSPLSLGDHIEQPNSTGVSSRSRSQNRSSIKTESAASRSKETNPLRHRLSRIAKESDD